MKKLVVAKLNGHLILQVPKWNELGVVHGFGVRGVNLSQYLSLPDSISPLYIPTTIQTHGTEVVLCDVAMNLLHKADAFITYKPRMACYVRTADCVPLLLFDAHKRSIAAVHAGWRGLASGVIDQSIDAMVKKYGSHHRNIQAAIGPGISSSAFVVCNDVCSQFQKSGFNIEKSRTKLSDKLWLVDLQELARQALRRSGVIAENIWNSNMCTHKNSAIFNSFRRDHNQHRQISFAMLTR